MIDPENKELSICEQCGLPGKSRSWFYCQPQRDPGREYQDNLEKTDQGSQFTSNEFTSLLEGRMVRISMDGKGRALDNISIERFWKTLKYEDIYLYRYDTLKQLRKGLLKYFSFYNAVRPHQSLNGNSPDQIYSGESHLKAA